MRRNNRTMRERENAKTNNNKFPVNILIHFPPKNQSEAGAPLCVWEDDRTATMLNVSWGGTTKRRQGDENSVYEWKLKNLHIKATWTFPTWKSQNPFEFDSLFTAPVYFWATYWFYSFYWILKFSFQISLKCSHEQIVEVFHQTNFATHSYDFQFNQCAANK